MGMSVHFVGDVNLSWCFVKFLLTPGQFRVKPKLNNYRLVYYDL